MIASFIEGRIRLRDAALKNPDNMSMLRGLVAARPGIISVTANSVTGSLLVCYDPAVLSREDLASAAALLETRFPSAKRKEKIRFFKNDISRLTLAFIAVLAAGLVNKRVHVAAGAVFTLLATAHACKERRSRPLLPE
ncbi:MAG: hypothetical protein LBM00_00085 [Deltaproteobacteria bacterium]|jgi:hypothetical protein|nr:hypothetical protein [Deltaproteobacteria bacterium]